MAQKHHQYEHLENSQDTSGNDNVAVLSQTNDDVVNVLRKMNDSQTLHQSQVPDFFQVVYAEY
jgi:hypothetical protein